MKKMLVRIVSALMTLCLVMGMSVYAQIPYDLNKDGEVNKFDAEIMKDALLNKNGSTYHLLDLVRLYHYTEAIASQPQTTEAEEFNPQIGTAYVAYRITDEDEISEDLSQTILEALLPSNGYTVEFIKSEMAANPDKKNTMTIHLLKDNLEMDINIVSSSKVFKLECQNNYVIFFDFEEAYYSMVA